VALLADLLDLPAPTRLQMSPELQRRKTIELLTQWTLAASVLQPLVVLVEDLHWCDPSSVELLGHLVAQSPTARMLILLTARPEFTPPWPAHASMTMVQLPRLANRQTRDMVIALTGDALPVETLDALVARADGVPLYVEELTKTVLEPGTPSAEGDPATLADSLMGRLDRVGDEGGGAAGGGAGAGVQLSLLAAVAGLEEAALRRGLAPSRRRSCSCTVSRRRHVHLQTRSCRAAYGSLLSGRDGNSARIPGCWRNASPSAWSSPRWWRGTTIRRGSPRPRHPISGPAARDGDGRTGGDRPSAARAAHATLRDA
jgi:hypothetical protein